LSQIFSSAFTTEVPNTVPSFHADKNDDIALSSITINPSVVFEKSILLKCGKAPDQMVGQLKFLKSVQIIYEYPLSILILYHRRVVAILPQDWKAGHTHIQKGQHN